MTPRDPRPCSPAEAVARAMSMVDRGGRYFVTKDDLASLGVYLVGLQSWVVAASGCLGVAP